LSEAAEGLRKVLDLERRRKFADTSVIGGLDRYLLRFAGEMQLSPSHPFSRVLQALPPGGYHALHPVQRRRFIEELLKAAADAFPAVISVRVREVLDYPANDVLELDSGLFLPLVEACVRQVDLEGGRIVIAAGFADPE